MEWQNGRQLSRATTERDSTTEDVLDFAYDANGIRTSKTVTRNTYRPVQTYKVTFVADGKTVKTMNVTEGYTLKDSDYPAVPEKAGYTGAWQRYPSPVKSNVTVSATYTKITTYYTVTFVADGFTVKTMQVYSGYKLKDSDYPSVPEKVGYTGHWNKITAPITKNTFVYAVYYSTDPTHIVTFYFAGEDYGTLTVDDGYILQDCDYPELPTRDGYTAYWDTYTQPIRKDITVTGNWEENAIIPPQPTDPPEIMSGDASEPVEAGAEAYASGALVSTETVTHEYLTQSGKIVREVITAPTETTTLDFFYDESGRPFAFNYTPEGSTPNTYYYILNLQGDVVQIIDEGGVLQAEYVYSPWGEVISAEGDLAEINPLRYRGYYYDSETGFYYLRSRYYDPENHRFINADTYASTDSSDAIACNMFAYCLGTPILLQDPDGKDSFGVSIGFSFWIFGWGFSVSAGIVGTDDDIGLQFSVARSDTFDTSSQMGVSIGPSVSVQVTDRTVTSGLDGPSTAVGGGKDLGFDALFDENNDYMGWQLNAGLDSGIIVPSADIHKITSKTYTVHVMPTINLPKRAKDWVYRDEKQ
ncbi:MAG: RHS repeat-associated core domain-containing protein [Oscillospiraceae bacterium]